MNTRSGSQVCTEEKTKVEEKERTEEEKVLRLRLIEAKKIKWEEGTIDNEHLGRKSSKRCCIYHKPKAFGESDSEESDSDTEKAKKDSENKQEKIKNYQRFHA